MAVPKVDVMPTTAPNRIPLTPLRSSAGLPPGAARHVTRTPSPFGLERSFRAHLENLTGETFLSFAQVRDAISIWAADDRGMHFFEAELSLPAIQSISGELLSLLSRPESDTRRIQWLSRSLYQALFRPISRILDPSRSIAIHCSGDLRCVPVGLLESEDGRLLVEQFSIWNAANFPWQAEKRRAAPISRDARLLIVDGAAGNAAEAGGMRASERNDCECAAAAFANHDTIHGASATREQVQQFASQADVLHCRASISNGVHCPPLHLAFDEAERAALPLSGHAFHAFPRCALGVLDVEYAGKETEETGEHWQRVCSALHYAGISNVLIPQWNLPAEARRSFFEAFYGELGRGASVRDARWQASLRLRDIPKWRHPHHWAGFTLSVSHL